MILRFATHAARLLVPFAIVVSSALCAQDKVHGADSIFSAPTVKIGWAVKKGASEQATLVMIRLVNSAGAYREVAVEGVDPFSNNRRVVAARQRIADQVDLVLPRSGFAEFPILEIQFYRPQEQTDSKSSLTVYYLGVPDTTPEFTTPEAADAYLTNILKAR
jgi:hypothetical protein